MAIRNVAAPEFVYDAKESSTTVIGAQINERGAFVTMKNVANGQGSDALVSRIVVFRTQRDMNEAIAALSEISDAMMRAGVPQG